MSHRQKKNIYNYSHTRNLQASESCCFPPFPTNILSNYYNYCKFFDFDFDFHSSAFTNIFFSNVKERVK